MSFTTNALLVAIGFFSVHGIFSVIGIFTILYERYDFLLGGIAFLILAVLFKDEKKNDTI